MNTSRTVFPARLKEANRMAEWLADLPLYWAKIMGTVFFVYVIIWALTRPKDYIFQGASNRRIWRDLRLWAVVILLVQIIIYVGF